MPPRRTPTPKSKIAGTCIELVAGGLTLKKAVDSCKGLNYSSVWEWIQIGDGRYDNVEYRRPPSSQLREACKDFAARYARAVQERDEKRVQDALEAIRVAAQEGHAGTRVVRESVPARVESTTTMDGNGNTKTVQKQIPAYTKETHEVEKERPDWRAAQVLLEKLAPDRYGTRSNVVLSSELTLREGEADAVAEACSDEERRAIERGDVKVLGVVLARVRAENKR